MEYKDEELIRRLNDAVVAKKLTHGDEGKLIAEMVTNLWEQSLYTLCFGQGLSERQRDELIARIRFYRYQMLNEMQNFIDTGEYAFELAQDRGLIRQPTERG